MEKEQVVKKLGDVFEAVAQRIIDNEGNVDANTLAEVKNLGETIIRTKQNITTEVHKAERFIERKVNIALQREADAIVDELQKRLSNENDKQC